MSAPAWLGATAGQPGQAGQVNQFLATHAISYVYAGTPVATQTTLGTASVSSDGLYIAQSFTASAAGTTGRAVLYLAVTGSPAPVVVSLYADASGPTGSPLASTAMPREFVTATAAALSVPLPANVSASTTYWLVTQAAGDVSDYFSWSQSNQTSGAMTSPDGVTWTAQSYGLAFQVFDQTSGGSLHHTWEDSGARWTSYAYAGAQLSTIASYTAGQTTAGYTVSSRTLTYAGNLLTGVA